MSECRACRSSNSNLNVCARRSSPGTDLTCSYYRLEVIRAKGKGSRTDEMSKNEKEKQSVKLRTEGRMSAIDAGPGPGRAHRVPCRDE